MEATLHQLGGILLKAVPTFLLITLLYFYLKGIFFQPMEKVLRRRYEATEGARKLAEDGRQRAASRLAEYEAAMRAARAEVYKAQEQLHRQLEEREAAELASARKAAEAALADARALIAGDVEAAKAALARDTEVLANQIAEAILRRSAA